MCAWEYMANRKVPDGTCVHRRKFAMQKVRTAGICHRSMMMTELCSTRDTNDETVVVISLHRIINVWIASVLT